MKQIDFTLGRWEISVRVTVSASVSIGLGARLMSWRRAYPWVDTWVVLGPFGLNVQFVRPDEIALQMRAERV